MKTLAIECSAAPVSVAVSEDGKIISSSFSNIKVTHSETLMPMILNTLKSAKSDLKDIECFAVANGPGSFTGIRIGISAIKGLAAPKNIPCVPVSTLYAMAYRFKFTNGIICPCMDARCNQLYNALFRVQNGEITRLTDDRALMCEELLKELEKYSDNIIVCGDGSDVFASFAKNNKNIKFADGELKYQNAVGVCLAAEEEFNKGNSLTPSEILPVYLRLPQAERELKSKSMKRND